METSGRRGLGGKAYTVTRLARLADRVAEPHVRNPSEPPSRWNRLAGQLRPQPAHRVGFLCTRMSPRRKGTRNSMADETPPARGFSSGSQGSSEGAPRLRGADVSVPCCWSLRNSSKWPGPTSSGPFLSLKSVCAEDRSRRQYHTAQAPAGAPGLCQPRRRVTPAPAPAGLAGRPGQAVPVASLNFRSSSPQRGRCRCGRPLS